MSLTIICNISSIHEHIKRSSPHHILYTPTNNRQAQSHPNMSDICCEVFRFDGTGLKRFLENDKANQICNFQRGQSESPLHIHG